MSVCLSCHIRDRSFCHNAHWQTNYKHEMHTCIQQNMQNGGWKQWRGTRHIFIFECGFDAKVSYSHVHVTNVNLWRPKNLQVHFSACSIYEIIPVPDCVERECGWWTMNWNWLTRKQSWNNWKMSRKFPGGVEDTKQNSSPDRLSRHGSEQDIFEIQVISLTDNSTYSVTEQIRCFGLLLIKNLTIIFYLNLL